MRAEWVGTDTLRARVSAALEQVEKRASTRCIPTHLVEEAIKAAESHPYGVAKGDGGAVPNSYSYSAKTTVFHLAWYTWRGAKHFKLRVERDEARKEAYGDCADMYVGTEPADRAQAYERALYDRSERYRALRLQRRVRDGLRGLPPFPAAAQIIRIKTEGGISFVETGDVRQFVGTPAGWFQIEFRWKHREESPWTILRRLGFSVPRKNRVWTEKLTAQAAMLILAK